MGAEHVLDDHAARLSRAAGAATRTWCGCARGGSTTRPTPWCAPGDAGQVAAVLAACGQAGVAVVPFGGGTSVVGGRGGACAAPTTRPSRST